MFFPHSTLLTKLNLPQHNQTATTWHEHTRQTKHTFWSPRPGMEWANSYNPEAHNRGHVLVNDNLVRQRNTQVMLSYTLRWCMENVTSFMWGHTTIYTVHTPTAAAWLTSRLIQMASVVPSLRFTRRWSLLPDKWVGTARVIIIDEAGPRVFGSGSRLPTGVGRCCVHHLLSVSPEHRNHNHRLLS